MIYVPVIWCDWIRAHEGHAVTSGSLGVGVLVGWGGGDIGLGVSRRMRDGAGWKGLDGSRRPHRKSAFLPAESMLELSLTSAALSGWRKCPMQQNPIMRTSTLIVRLAGIYVFVQGLFALFNLAQVPVSDSGAVLDPIKAVKYLVAFGTCLGLVVARYAGWFAKILTFDAVDKRTDDSGGAGDEEE